MNSKWHNLFIALQALSLAACGTAQDTAAAAQEQSLTAQFFAPELGKGVDAAETRTFIKCVNFAEPRRERLPFSKRLYQDYSVTTRQELDQKLNLSASASAKGLWGDVGGNASYFRDKEFDSDAFYWVVDANYELVHESIPTNDAGFGLTDRAKSLLQTQGIKGFIRACGTHFYVGRTLGGRYVMLYEFRSNQDKFIDNIKATAHAKANFGLEGETELARAIQSANRSAFMKVSTEVTGGDASLDSYAGDPNLLKTELFKLRNALEAGSGQVLEWEMVSYEVFEEFQQAERESGYRPAFDTERRDALEIYYTTYTQNQQRLTELKTSLKRASGEAPQIYFTPAKASKIRALMDTLQGAKQCHCQAGPRLPGRRRPLRRRRPAAAQRRGHARPAARPRFYPACGVEPHAVSTAPRRRRHRLFCHPGRSALPPAFFLHRQRGHRRRSGSVCQREAPRQPQGVAAHWQLGAAAAGARWFQPQHLRA